MIKLKQNQMKHQERRNENEGSLLYSTGVFIWRFDYSFLSLENMFSFAQLASQLHDGDILVTIHTLI